MPSAESTESRAADAITAVWMIAVINTLLCLLISAAAQGYYNFEPQATLALFFSRWILLAAGIVGFIVLILTFVVRRVRRVPPPFGVTVFAALVGVTPLIAWLIVFWRG